MSHPVGLVHDWLTGQRGGENVLAAVARLFPRAPIYTLFHFPGSVAAEIEAHPIVTSFLQGAPGLDPAYRWYLPVFPVAVEDLPVADHRLVLSTSHCVAKGVRRGPGALHVCYCHTPMRYAWDQEAAYFGGRRGPVAALQRRVLSALRRWDVATAGRVDHYLANSSFVAGRIRRYYGREAEVLHPPVDVDFFAPGTEPRGDFVVMVAALGSVQKGGCRDPCLRTARNSPRRRRRGTRAGPSRSPGRALDAPRWAGLGGRAARALSARDLLPAAGDRGLRHRRRRSPGLRHPGRGAGRRRGPRHRRGRASTASSSGRTPSRASAPQLTKSARWSSIP